MMPVRVALLLPVLGCGGQDPARAQDPTIPKPAVSAQDPSPPSSPEQGKPVNRLAKETSPYLRLHQHNPVDWFPWGEEALALAKAKDKPIFLSIGYSACHWCHVMERESFEDEEIAALMNELFVCIKVDREERPDIDELYMAATQAMTGAGGWPMSVWLTPDLVPFYAGTYFPPHRSLGRPGFKQVIEELAKAFAERREQVDATAEQIREHLAMRLAPEARPGEPSLAFGTAIVASAAERFDPEHGGFGQVRQQGAPASFAPKFPHASELGVLLREAARTGDAKALSMAEQTLEHMARGGMYDQLAGGFHRYSTDREWLVPHFEKMLYDNALLARTYCEAYAQTGKPFYARVARQTLDYMMREMQDPRGGFYSTTDAQSEGVEGKYFVWKGAEFDAACGDDAAVARRHWGVTDDGNWEHVNVLHWAASPAQVAAAVNQPVADVEAAIERARIKLLAVRGQRIPPPLDDKVLTAWNGMAIAAMAVGHQVLGDERYLQSAQRAAGFVLSELRRDGRLLRTWRDVEGVAEAKLAGYLEDYGFLADGLLCLVASDGDARWLEAARELLQVVRDQFADPVDGNFFFTANDHEQLLARSKSVIESSTPSGIAMVVQSLLRAGLMLGEPALEEAAEAAMRANFDMLDRHPIGCPSLVQAVQFHLGNPREVVVAGAADDPRTAALLDVARRHAPPHVVVLHVHEGNRAALSAVTPLVTGKEPVDGAPAAYVCRRGVCEAPVTDAAALGAALGR